MLSSGLHQSDEGLPRRLHELPEQIRLGDDSDELRAVHDQHVTNALGDHHLAGFEHRRLRIGGDRARGRLRDYLADRVVCFGVTDGNRTHNPWSHSPVL
jgi:hypothetical protein